MMGPDHPVVPFLRSYGYSPQVIHHLIGKLDQDGQISLRLSKPMDLPAIDGYNIETAGQMIIIRRATPL